MRVVLQALGLLSLAIAAVLPAWAASQMVPASVVALLTPEYPQAARDAGLTGLVHVVVQVDSDGLVAGSEASSPIPDLVGPVKDSLQYWYFYPGQCFQAGRYQATFDVEFSKEGERFFVTVRNLAYSAEATGPVIGGKLYSGGSLKRVAGDPPVYPRRAIQANLERALAIAALSIDEQGGVEVVKVFSYPKVHFEREVREAISEWRFEPWRDGAGLVKHLRTCVTVNFRMAD